MPERYPKIELGRNQDSFEYQKQNFTQDLLPIIDAARSNPSLDQAIYDQLAGDRLRRQTRFSAEKIAAQQATPGGRTRGLTDLEGSFIASTEARTAFNPSLVALARADKQLLFINLVRAAELQTKKTCENFPTGSYIPDLIVGAGPAGQNALSVMSWLNPELAANAVVVDSGERAGGPFAVPNGPAWKLNSGIQSREILVADPLRKGPKQDETIRGYANPGVDMFYVSERTRVASKKARDLSVETRGSINRFSVDGITPDMLSSTDFANSFDVDLAANLNHTLNARWGLFNSEVVSLKRSGRPIGEGKYEVIVEVPDYKNQRLENRTYFVDRLYFSTGLGRDRNGFATDPSKRGFEVLQQSRRQKTGVSKYSTTLTFMRQLVNKLDRERGKNLGNKIAIIGVNDSFKILGEILLGIFDAGIYPSIDKIYVVSAKAKTADEFVKTERPRYLALANLIQRAEREGKVEFVVGRVDDVGFTSPPSTNIEDQTLYLYNPDGSRIKTTKGKNVEVDNVISAAGFEDRLSELLRPLAATNGREIEYAPISLPTNPDVIVGQQVKSKTGELEDIIVLGTASDPALSPKTRQGREKLDQLPEETQKTLATLPAENLVALAIRMPDVAAATREFLRRSKLVPTGEPKPWQIKKESTFRTPVKARIATDVSKALPTVKDGIPRTLTQENGSFTEVALLSFIAQTLNQYEFKDQVGNLANTELTFAFTRNTTPNTIGSRLRLETVNGATPYSSVLFSAIAEDPFILAHAERILDLKPKAERLIFIIPVKQGLIQPRNASTLYT